MSVFEREQEFSNGIDCSFPYSDLRRAGALIDEAQSISTNACFCVLYEILLPPSPRPAALTIERQHELLSLWRRNIQHPLAETVVVFADQVLARGRVLSDDAIAVMEAVGEFNGQYAALAVVSGLACDDQDGGAVQTIDALESAIRAGWDNAINLQS